MQMAWASWGLGAAMIVVGTGGLFYGVETGSLIVSGTSLITLVVGIVVAGKVAQDKTSHKETKK